MSMNVPAHLFKEQENQKQRGKNPLGRFCLIASNVDFKLSIVTVSQKVLVHVIIETEH